MMVVVHICQDCFVDKGGSNKLFECLHKIGKVFFCFELVGKVFEGIDGFIPAIGESNAKLS